MDHAGNLAAVLCLDGNAVAVSPHGDDGILEISPQRPVYHAGQGRMYFVVHLPDGAADML